MVLLFMLSIDAGGSRGVLAGQRSDSTRLGRHRCRARSQRWNKLPLHWRHWRQSGKARGNCRVPRSRAGYQHKKFAAGKSGATAPSEAIRLRYPDGSHDAESLLVHPRTGNIYIVTKIAFAFPGIYEARAPVQAGQPITLTRVGTLEVPSLLGGIITGGAISPDGRRVAFCDYMQGYEAVLENANSSFDTIWKRPLTQISLGNRKQGEAITYRLDSKALLMTSEGTPMPLIQVERR